MFHLGQSSGYFRNPARIPVCELCSASSGSGWGGQGCIGGDSRHAPSRHFQAASGPSPWNPDWNPRGIDRPRWKDRDRIGAGADALPSLSSAPLLVGRDSVAITRVQIYQITRWVCKSISLEARCMVIMCSSVPFSCELTQGSILARKSLAKRAVHLIALLGLKTVNSSQNRIPKRSLVPPFLC